MSQRIDGCLSDQIIDMSGCRCRGLHAGRPKLAVNRNRFAGVTTCQELSRIGVVVLRDVISLRLVYQLRLPVCMALALRTSPRFVRAA